MKKFKNKKVTVMGLGTKGGGLGVVRFLVKRGAKVLVTDLKKEEELGPSLQELKDMPVKLVLGIHREEDFINADLVIKGPDVPNSSPYLKIARKHNTPIETDVGIFFELCPCPIIGVTGTKGKSTTVALIQKVLKKKYNDVYSAGNIGTSVLDILPYLNKNSIVVLELSSFQLERLEDHKKSPRIAVITNIYPEHLNRYSSFEEYVESKKNIFKFQNSEDFLILNDSFKELAQEAESEVRLFPRSAEALREGKQEDKEEIARIVGSIYKVKSKQIEKAIGEFKGLRGRLELVEKIEGVEYYNDTCATHPQATLYSLNKLLQKENIDSNNIILIAGGKNKKLNFKHFRQVVGDKIKSLILLPGTASDKIKVEKSPTEVNTMEEAVREAKNQASEGDIVLLSPASASFNLFKDEFERGQKFVGEVNKLKE